MAQTISDESSRLNPPIASMIGHIGSITCMQLSQDGQRMLTGSDDGTAILWDLDKLESIVTFNVKKGATVTYTAFANSNGDIITATDEDIVYLWKTDKPSTLHAKGLLYRYAPFNYNAWYLQKGDYKEPLEDSTVAQQYMALLHSLLNLPAIMEYPNDPIYTDALKNAFIDIKARHTHLHHNKEIKEADAALLRLYYTKALKKEQEMFKTSGLELKKMEALEQLDDWHDLLKGTTSGNGYGRLTFEFQQDYKFFEKRKLYAEQAAYIRFYADSILQPLSKQYGQNNYLLQAKRQVDISWLRVYICNKNDTAAINKAKAIAEQYPTNPSLDYRLYQVATYLIFDKYAEAANLYQSINGNHRFIHTTNLILNSFLKEFMAKSTNPAAIQAFIKEISNKKVSQ